MDWSQQNFSQRNLHPSLAGVSGLHRAPQADHSAGGSRWEAALL
jgi:hypothetical protein